ncbi:kinase-like protein [Microthyrium microscopicum]|uniref:ethanolamine kinase n=1 Tax=Microthyrium microscopicum TaxID=703497 RepID=A0A6A6U9A5_9PEZI|nr:kinase-like protein [Microthyrium microscopicum]
MGPAPKYIDLAYDHANSDESALKLVATLFPDWASQKDTVQFIRFKDGITNTLLKVINKRPGYTEEQIDRDAVLLRAYGNGTQVLIDRDRECASHSLLASHNLAPPLLARFKNGLLYRFISGKVCSPADLRRSDVWRAVARRLAEWHATLPISAILDKPGEKNSSKGPFETMSKISSLPSPNIWTVMYRWSCALPDQTDSQSNRKAMIQKELEWMAEKLGDVPGIHSQQLIFAHCDLLHGNVIVQPSAAHLHHPSEHSEPSSSASSPLTAPSMASDRDVAPVKVHFIDYEYATPSPVAFDIANHFAEWGGFDCDFTVLPTRAQRRNFLSTYLQAYNSFKGREFESKELEQLMAEVDLFRGVPGFYWGIWAIIQAEISSIDFDYANYAEVRMSEYWAWKKSLTNENGQGDQVPVRERRWAQDE